MIRVRGGPLARHREKVKTAILAALVGLSFFLSAGLWLRTPGGGAPPRPQPYVAEGLAAGAPLADVLLPRRIVLHRSGRHAVVAAPAEEAFRLAVAAAAQALGAAARQGAGPVPAPASEVAALQQGGRGMELVLPAELPVGDWLAAWAGEEAARGLSRSGLRRVPARRVAVFLAADGQAVVLLEGAGGWLRVAAGDGGGLRASFDRLGEAGEEAVLLTGRWLGLKVPEGLYVPAAPRFVRLAAEEERLTPDRLARSFFPDLAVVRRVDGEDGSLLFTDGRQGLRIGADGAVRFDGPQAAARKGGEPSLPDQVRQAVAFVASHGGWPPALRLHAVRAEPGGTRVDFAPAFGGYPLLRVLPGEDEPAGRPAVAPVSVTMAGAGGVTAYLRAVSSPAGDGGRVAALPAARALDAVDAAWAGGAGSEGRPTLVVDVYPAYLAGPAGAAGGDRRPDGLPAGGFQPAWVIDLADGRRVAVDAASGRVAGGVAGPAGER